MIDWRLGCVAAGILLGAVAPRAPAARVVPVHDAASLRAAIGAAQAGDVITLAAGTYDLVGSLRCAAAGRAEAPITVRAGHLGEAVVRFDALEGFHLLGPHWTIENLDIRGVCADDSDCEHAFHIVGEADGAIVRGNRVADFNAHIKGNGAPVGPAGAFVWPDDVRIEGNELFDSRPRNTANPVTPIDVVGGRRWVVRANYIHDHEKAGGDHISYAAFLKGNSRDGLVERNLVVCERLTRGGIRLGLSFGGGGSSPDRICEEGSCAIEHQDGTLRNNLILNCPADVGIYLNEAKGTRVYHNTLYNTAGIDVRFAVTDAELRGNILSGRIRERDGGRANRADNLEQVPLADFARWFADPAAADFSLKDGRALVDQGQPLAALPDDYCAQPRADGRPDLGAVEYTSARPCDTTRPPLAPPAAPTATPPTATPTPTPVSATGTATATPAVSATPRPSTTPTREPAASPTPGGLNWRLHLPWAMAGRLARP